MSSMTFTVEGVLLQPDSTAVGLSHCELRCTEEPFPDGLKVSHLFVSHSNMLIVTPFTACWLQFWISACTYMEERLGRNKNNIFTYSPLHHSDGFKGSVL